MKKLVWIIFSSLLILVAVLTNPKQEEHQEAVSRKLRESFRSYLKEDMEEEDDMSLVGSALGLMFGETFIETLVDGVISADNLVVFSLTRASFEGESRLIGVGCFGNVFLSKEVDEMLDELDKQIETESQR